MTGEDQHHGKRVAIYARVSTKRQENESLSVSEQIVAAERWATEHACRVVTTFVDARSAVADERRQLQEMIAMADSDEHPIDIILVYSLSRLSRDALHLSQHSEQLGRRRIEIVSIMQELDSDAASDFVARMLAPFNE